MKNKHPLQMFTCKMIYYFFVFLSITLCASCMNPFAGSQWNGNEFDSNLPLIVIDTFGAAIIDEPKIPAYIEIFDNPGQRNNLSGKPAFAGDIGIEVRGQSSRHFPKKSYGFEIRDNNGEDMHVSILGLPAECDWILYGPYSDKSLLRNHLAYTLTNQTGNYASRTRFVELFFIEGYDAAYAGVYVLMEKIKRGPNRVDIAEPEPAQENKIFEISNTGGYILKIDKVDDGDGYFITRHDIRILYVYPPAGQITAAQQSRIKQYIDDFETTLVSDEFDHPERGYAAYIDTGSFIDYMLLREFFRDVDTYSFSTFMHKDREGKLKMGPVWDFNLGMGNCSFGYEGKSQGWEIDRKGANRNTFWWRRLLTDQNFKNKAIQRWRELRTGVLSMENIFSVIDNAVLLLDEAQQRNFERWPVLGIYVWPNTEPYPETYAGEITNLKTWITERAAWMDDNMCTID